MNATIAPMTFGLTEAGIDLLALRENASKGILIETSRGNGASRPYLERRHKNGVCENAEGASCLVVGSDH
jgi:hypothetical protein